MIKIFYCTNLSLKNLHTLKNNKYEKGLPDQILKIFC